MSKGAFIVIGAQWGDEGKGLISSYLSAREKARLVCKGGVGPNAEHGIFTLDEKTYLKVNQLPLGWIFNPDAYIMIGSGVAVDPVKLRAEMERYNLENRVFLDLRSPIITKEHIEAEEKSKGMQKLGSTMSGSGHCKADFILRKAKQVRDIKELSKMALDGAELVNSYASTQPIIVESSQGTELSLAISLDYPNTTSDNVTTMAVCDDVLLNWKYIRDVVMVVKALPTREGAGGMGAEEFTIEEIDKNNLKEISSIKGATRRKAKTINMELLKKAAMINGATQLALTFCEQYDPGIANGKEYNDITYKTWQLIEKIEDYLNLPVTILNTGKAYNNIIDRRYPDSVDWGKIDRYVSSLTENKLYKLDMGEGIVKD